MKQTQQKNGRREPWDDSGQAVVFVLMLLAVFLFGVAALGVDFANLWFHRQSAQTAADAACTAGAMDMLTDFNTGVANQGGFTPGTDFVCASGSTIAPCQYAALNGYASGDTTPGSKVSVSFPTSAAVPGLDASVIPPTGMAANAFIKVDVIEHVGTFFAGLLAGGQRSLDVRSFAVCGVLLAQSPVPLLVLDPQGSSVDINGGPVIRIVGGPSTSIQINSNDNAAVSFSGTSSQIDLSLGGPSGTGSNIGVFGGPRTTPTQFNGGTTGHWQAPQTPVGDPYARLPAPAQPLYNGAKTSVAYGVHGCPDTGGCDEYSAGYYPTGITVKNATAIFQEGIYYVAGGMALQANSTARPSTQAASQPSDQIGGTIFYFSGSNSLSVDANSGGRPLDTFNTTSGSGVYSFGAKCTAASNVPTNLPASLDGSVLLAPCTGPSRTPCVDDHSSCYGDPSGTGGPLGEQRGLLFFQDRSAAIAKKDMPDWSGGGQSLLAGSLYFHHCNASGTGTSCGSPPTYYNNVLGLGGNSGSGTYILGNTITDNLNMHGNPVIAMDLNPTASYAILKASLLR
jgi:Putative Flp pilus-assembly TadE/G-like